MVWDTIILPTLVQMTFPLYKSATSLITDEELTGVTIFSSGLLFKKLFSTRANVLSPQWISPFSSTNIERSASPSYATPKSAFTALTVIAKSFRFSGLGSGSLPGNVPSMLAFMVVTLHPSSRSKLGAARLPTLFAASTTM